MPKLEGFSLKEHSGAGAVFGAKFVAAINLVIAIVADDGVSVLGKMFADLVISSGPGNGFDESEFSREILKNFKVRFGAFCFAGFGFGQGLKAGPEGLSGMSVDNGEVAFLNFVAFESNMKFARYILINGEEENAGGRAIKPVDGIYMLADLIADDFHGDFVARLRIVGGNDHLPGWFVHGDDPLVLVDNIDGLGLQGAMR